MTDVICDAVNLADLSEKLVSKNVVFVIAGEEESTLTFLFFLIVQQLFAYSNCFGHITAGICFDFHQLSYIALLIDAPILIKLLQQSFNFGPKFLQIIKTK